jgi:hypothetical protein
MEETYRGSLEEKSIEEDAGNDSSEKQDDEDDDGE